MDAHTLKTETHTFEAPRSANWFGTGHRINYHFQSVCLMGCGLLLVGVVWLGSGELGGWVGGEVEVSWESSWWMGGGWGCFAGCDMCCIRCASLIPEMLFEIIRNRAVTWNAFFLHFMVSIWQSIVQRISYANSLRKFHFYIFFVFFLY